MQVKYKQGSTKEEGWVDERVEERVPRGRGGGEISEGTYLLIFVLVFSKVLAFLLLATESGDGLGDALSRAFSFMGGQVRDCRVCGAGSRIGDLMHLLSGAARLDEIVRRRKGLDARVLSRCTERRHLAKVLMLSRGLGIARRDTGSKSAVSL